ncbi:MAG: glutathione S-transferase family protein [Pseudomonadota bacterium]
MIDVIKGQTRTEEFLKVNSLGQVPVLELDDGRYLAESIAICRYLEHLHPEPALFGRTPEERAFIEMWARRIELGIFGAIGDVALHEFEFCKDRVDQNAGYAASRRHDFQKQLRWLDSELSDERPFLAGGTFSIADIIGMSMLIIVDFGRFDIPGELRQVKRWEASVRARPSFPRLP